jgi:hypothetical protein
LSFSPDGTVAYFSESGPYERDSPRRAECLPRLFRYSSASGAVEHVGEGTGGVESPDRRYLAYVASAVQRGVADSFPSIGCGIYVVVVRDLQTGVERESIFSDERGGEASVVGAGSLAWSPDSTRLAYEAGFEGSWTYVFDLATSTTTRMKFGETVEQLGLGRFGGADMGSPRWTSRSELLVWIGCYACGRQDLTAVSDDGRVVSSLVEQRTHPFVPTARDGWVLQWDRSPSGAVYDYFVVAPNGSRRLLATGVQYAMWPGNDAFALRPPSVTTSWSARSSRASRSWPAVIAYCESTVPVSKPCISKRTERCRNCRCRAMAPSRSSSKRRPTNASRTCGASRCAAA